MSFCSFSGGEEFKNHFQPGIYVCSECEHELFSSKSKFEHSSPWPAFSETIHEDSVSKHPEINAVFIQYKLYKQSWDTRCSMCAVCILMNL
uniref:Methionine sulfoxide reductase B1 n=1 Tax=Acanthochromis polyacanthus TaxID=80966 RepID=A0A3Q1H052_9TELE